MGIFFLWGGGGRLFIIMIMFYYFFLCVCVLVSGEIATRRQVSSFAVIVGEI